MSAILRLTLLSGLVSCLLAELPGLAGSPPASQGDTRNLRANNLVANNQGAFNPVANNQEAIKPRPNNPVGQNKWPDNQAAFVQRPKKPIFSNQEAVTPERNNQVANYQETVNPRRNNQGATYQETQNPWKNNQGAKNQEAINLRANNPVADNQRAVNPGANNQAANNPVANNQEAINPNADNPLTNDKETVNPNAIKPVAKNLEAVNPAGNNLLDNNKRDANLGATNQEAINHASNRQMAISPSSKNLKVNSELDNIQTVKNMPAQNQAPNSLGIDLPRAGQEEASDREHINQEGNKQSALKEPIVHINDRAGLSEGLQQRLDDIKKRPLLENARKNELETGEKRQPYRQQPMDGLVPAADPQRQGRDQQSVADMHMQKQKEQYWVAEVQRKSQEALVQRQVRQKQLLNQDFPGANINRRDHDLSEHQAALKDKGSTFTSTQAPYVVGRAQENQHSGRETESNGVNRNLDENNRKVKEEYRVDNQLQANLQPESELTGEKHLPDVDLNNVNPPGVVKDTNKLDDSFQKKGLNDPGSLGDSWQGRSNGDNGALPGHNPVNGLGENQNGQALPVQVEPRANVLGQDNNNNNINNNIVINSDGAKYEFNSANQPQQPPQIGGINLSWDWEDFSIMFNSYGGAEMKVRRSPHPSTGEPWPMPQYYSKRDDKIYKVSRELHFISTGVKCDILDEALGRHLQRTLRGCVEDMYDNLQNAEGSPVEDPALKYEKEEFIKALVISRLEVRVRKPCEKYPSLESDESYDLVVKKKKTYIWANEVWGALRGLETFGHLVWKGTDGQLYIKETVISDYPRFPHRGLHIDTSRHYLFKEVILDILDSMEMNKLNVFHWHIVDDQSFPYESKVYPELSRKGAFHPTYVYTLEDIAEIIEYARLRGIRVMPEFDTPGHTYSWGLSRPELLTQCYSGSLPVKGYLGPIDPSKNSTYRFLQTLFKEIVEVFKDEYVHLGGDEVPLGCWQSNPEVVAFAQELARRPRDPTEQSQGQSRLNNFNGGWNVWSDDIRRVYEYYENRLINIVNEIGQKRKKGVKYVMWQEVMNNNLQLPNDTIIQVWMGDMADVMRATAQGYQVIYSTCWYLDRLEYGTKWPKYYNCDPADQSYGFHIDEKKVLGGEAAFWAEYFSNENLIPLMWPRASAVAERLWSNKDVKNLDKAAERLTEHRCRMLKRGISAGEINGPSYCLHAPPRRRLYNDTLGCKGGNCSRTHNFVQIEDFEVHLSQRGGSLADCGHMFSQGNGNVLVMLLLVLVVVLALYLLSKSSSHLHRIRICRNRSILLVFVGVLLVYLLCYTTIWMRAFEFSGSFHKTLQEGNNHVGGGNSEEENSNFRPINS